MSKGKPKLDHMDDPTLAGVAFGVGCMFGAVSLIVAMVSVSWWIAAWLNPQYQALLLLKEMLPK